MEDNVEYWKKSVTWEAAVLAIASEEGLDKVVDRLIGRFGVDEVVSACCKSLSDGILDIVMMNKTASFLSLRGLGDRLQALKTAEMQMRRD